MINETMWHAEGNVFRAITGGAYRLPGPYGLIIYGSVFPKIGTIPMSDPRPGTIISQGAMVRGTDTFFTRDVLPEYFLHAKNVVRKVKAVISDTLLELEGGFPTNIASPGEGLRICRPQVFKEVYAKSTGGADATALQEAPFEQNLESKTSGSPISFDATAGEISFELKQ